MQVALKKARRTFLAVACASRDMVSEGIVLVRTRIAENIQGADKPLNKADEHADCGSCPVR